MPWMMARKGIAMMGTQPRRSRVRGSRRCGLLRRSASASVGHTRTKTNAGLVAVVAVGSLILAGCGGTTDSGTSRAASAPQVAAGVCGTVGATGPGGGKIFYVDMSRPAGSQCFEVAPGGWSGGSDPGARWVVGCGETNISGTAVGMGTGEANTTAIVGLCATSGIAARLADNYAGGSQTDWFLPSRDELNLVCKYVRGQPTKVGEQYGLCARNGTLHDGFAADLYWSSSRSRSGAWAQFFNTGKQLDSAQAGSFRVRPVRAF